MRRSLYIKNELKHLSFQEVYDQYKSMLYHHAAKWKRTYDKDDLVQEASIALWDAYLTYNSDNYTTSFSSYAYVYIKNRLLKYHREQRSKTHLKTSKIKYVDRLEDCVSTDSTNELTVKDTIISDIDVESDALDRLSVNEIINNLTDRQKTFLLLTADGYSQREIARKLDVGRGTVYKDLKQVRDIYNEKNSKTNKKLKGER